MTPEQIQEIRNLRERGEAIRAIARRLGCNVKTVRLALGEHRSPSPPGKLDPFREATRKRVKMGLRSPRILREIREMGYQGSGSLLKKYLRTLTPPQPPAPPVRRFETPPGREQQADWSVYRVLIAGVLCVVHAFSMVQNFSRMLFAQFCRNEKLPTLLDAHVSAFEYFQGSCLESLYDNMATVTFGRLRGQPQWNPAFLEFARWYGFTPKVCRVRDPKRKGRVERMFHFLETDFLRGREFASWEDLNAQVRVWLDTVANCRKHGTTHAVPAERHVEERPFLIRLPERRYGVEQRLTRQVDRDGTVQVSGSFFPVPGLAPGAQATVLLWPDRLEVLDRAGKTAARYALPDRPTRILPAGGTVAVQRPALSRTALEARFLALCPGAEAYLAGLVRRMKGLATVHFRRLESLAELYGGDALRVAVERAGAYGNFNAHAVARILEQAHPDVVPPPPPAGPFVAPEVLGALDDVDPGSPTQYRFEATDREGGATHGA